MLLYYCIGLSGYLSGILLALQAMEHSALLLLLLLDLSGLQYSTVKFRRYGAHSGAIDSFGFRLILTTRWEFSQSELSPLIPSTWS